MYISMKEIYLLFIAFILTLSLINLVQRKAAVQGQILEFSFGENEHLRNFQSKIFVFAIPVFVGLFIGMSNHVLGINGNIVFVSILPTSAAILFTVSSVFFVPSMLIEPLRRSLFKTRVLYLFLSILYGVGSGSAMYLVKALSIMMTDDALTYSILNPIIIAFVLWFAGFVFYLFSIKSYRKIKEEYLEEYNREDEKLADKEEIEYIIRQEMAEVFSDSVYSAYKKLHNELNGESDKIKARKLELVNDELIKKIDDLELMLELAESNISAREFRNRFYHEGYVPPRYRRSRPNFYYNDFNTNRGYFG